MGFEYPKENWSKLPHALIEALPRFSSQGELAVVLYILRHTWGYQEFDEVKRITLDEFENGRKKHDGSRIDKGVGMSRNAIRRGIASAIEHGFIIVEEDDSDLARIKRLYKLAMKERVQSEPPEGSKRTPRGSKIDPRSEKDTIERNQEKKTVSKKTKPQSPLDFAGYWKDPSPNGFLEQMNHRLAQAMGIGLPETHPRVEARDKHRDTLLEECRIIAKKNEQEPLSEEVERDILRAIDYAGMTYAGKFPFKEAKSLTRAVIDCIIEVFRNREWEAALADPYEHVRQL